MTYAETIMKLASLRHGTIWEERIATEIAYLDGVSKAAGDAYNALLQHVSEELLAAPITEETVLKAEAALCSLIPVAKAYTLLYLAHAHIDMNWTWGYQETAVVTTDTFRTMLDLMEEFPAFTFSQSQASVYKLVEETAPDMLEEIRRRVKEGRWEITASHWVEADKNLPSGESLSRQILYTKQYLSKLFDLPYEYFCIDFEPDTFGHGEHEPEILANGGVKYLYHFRGRDSGPYLYRFESPSGQQILTLRSYGGYSTRVDERSILTTPEFCSQYGVPVHAYVYGVGDHGGGPSRIDIKRILRYQSWPLMPTIRFGTWHEFFSMLEPYRDRIAISRGEQEELFTGCYTSQAYIKMGNRTSEARVVEAEQLSAAATLLTGAESRTSVLGSAWREILFNQFHDILPGSCVPLSREHAMGHYQDAMAKIFPTSNYAMRCLARAIDTTAIPFDDEDCSLSEGAGVGWYQSQCMYFRQPAPERGRGSYRVIHAFNTTAYERDELVEFMIWDYNVNIFDAEVVTPDGKPLPFLITHADGYYGGHRFSILMARVTVPALGYTTFVVRPAEGKPMDRGCAGESGALGFKSQKLRIDESGHLQNASWVDMFRDRHIKDKPYELENEKLYARFDPITLKLIVLRDKTTGVDLLYGKPSAYFRLIHENARYGMTSWRVGPYMKVIDLNETCDTHVYEYTRSGISAHEDLIGYTPGMVEDMEGTLGKGLRERLCYDMRFGSSSMKIEIELKAGSEVLEFRLTVDWHEAGQGGYMVPQLNFAVPFGYTAKSFIGDVPGGLVCREAKEQDVPVSTFLFVPGAGKKSIGLVSDCKHGFRGTDGMATISLLRTSTDPDPCPDQGTHYMKLGVAAASDAVDMVRIAELFQHPICYTSGGKRGGYLPSCGSMMTLEGEGLRLGAVKHAEDGNGVILRLTNLCGAEKTAVLHWPVPMTEAWLTDSCEIPQTALKTEDTTLRFVIAAHATVTVKVR